MRGKKIIIGITGSIAAYKIASLVRLLIKNENEVKILMTNDAQQFISPLTLSTLSKQKVSTELFSEGEWENHVKLALWGDVFIIAPATANTIAKMANGICDNILLAVYLSSRCPVFVAPAMDLDMIEHQTTKNNLSLLKSYGNEIIPCEEGELASGLFGNGRMASPENIILFLHKYFEKKADLLNKRILITSGATREAIDPVRFLTNNSTGKMGAALADECIKRGAKVVFIAGKNSKMPMQNNNLQVIEIITAEDMFLSVNDNYSDCDIAIFAAAVADYTPQNFSTTKIKKNEDVFQISLIKTKDIALEMGKLKKAHQVNIGFALETNNEQENSLKKIKSKNFDAIILNSLQDKGAGFANDTNKITIFDKYQVKIEFNLKSKTEVAADIINYIKTHFIQ